MHWLLNTRRVLLVPALLVMASCQTLSGTPTIELAGRTEAQIAREVCELFPNQDYDGELDTRLTVEQLQRFNMARDAYCKETDR